MNTTTNPSQESANTENEIALTKKQMEDTPMNTQAPTIQTVEQAQQAAKRLRSFINPLQLAVMLEVCQGEEAPFMFNTIAKLVHTIDTMPKTYETQDIEDPIVHLHYFIKDMNWYVTEKDMEAQQLQAFGKADLGWGFPEMGYICIEELLQNGVELDLFWTPVPVSQI